MDDEITIEQIAAEMDELGRTKLELAIARVQNRRQATRIAELENASAPTVPSRHPTIPGEDGSPVEVPS